MQSCRQRGIVLSGVTGASTVSVSVQDNERVATVRGIRKLACGNRQVAGDRWTMISDAAGFVSPILSSGRHLAPVLADQGLLRSGV